MKTEAFITAYNESRNGADFFVRHALVRTFAFSNGVQECADAGCHWMIDIAATEIPREMRDEGENLVTFAAQWTVEGCDINYENELLYCSHCGTKMPSAYGEES